MSKKDILQVFVSAFLGTLIIMWATDDGESAIDGSKNKSMSAVAVEVIQPKIETVANYLEYLGTVQGEKDGNLSFRIPGTLSSVQVREGEEVKKGKVLAKLEVPELDAQLERAESEFEKAKSAKAFWQNEMATDSSLFKEGAIAETVLNKTVFNYEQALSSYRAAKAALAEVSEREALTRLTAPSEGKVGSIMVREGSNVGPNQPVFFFHQGALVVHADILEQDIQTGIKVGGTVLAETQEATIKGKIERVDFQAKPPFRSVRVFVSFPPKAIADRPSGAGLPLKFEINKQEKAFMVPISAVDLRGGTPRLLRVSDQMEVEEVQVELGVQKGEYRQVTGRVSQKDKFISAGVSNVEPGDRVEVVKKIVNK